MTQSQRSRGLEFSSQARQVADYKSFHLETGWRTEGRDFGLS